MAKRTRVPAVRGRVKQTARRPTGEKPVKSGNKAMRKLAVAETERAHMARRRVYTPELLAFLRHRVEQTEDTWSEIGIAAGMHPDAVRYIARRQKWSRYVPPPRGLPAGVKLLAQAEALERHHELGFGNHDASTSAQGDGAKPLLADTIARLHRLVLDELAELESLRRQSNRRPRGSASAVRTLSALTETLQKLQRLQPDHANPGPDDADIPADIDEFRNELARRIDAFIAERTDAGDDRGAIPSPMDASG